MSWQVSWDRGVYLPALGFWLDPQVVREEAFVSHAHSDHARRHRLAWLSVQTLALLPSSRRPHLARPLEFGVSRQMGSAWLTLYPSGHMLGAAQLLFEHEGIRILYTGDLRLRGTFGSMTALPAADVLVVESTYGRPHFRFPQPDEMVERIAVWCRRAIDLKVTPVLVCHALGKAQELMVALAPYGFTFALESRCLEPSQAYANAGIALPDYVELRGEAEPGSVVIVPPTGRGALSELGRYRSALVSGWAMEPDFWRRFGVDTAFALSDHCDFDDLVEVVKQVSPKRVYTIHGFTEDLARHLRRRGVRASALSVVEQLELELG